jgi:hypothetical protein
LPVTSSLAALASSSQQDRDTVFLGNWQLGTGNWQLVPSSLAALASSSQQDRDTVFLGNWQLGTGNSFPVRSLRSLPVPSKTVSETGNW